MLTVAAIRRQATIEISRARAMDPLLVEAVGESAAERVEIARAGFADAGEDDEGDLAAIAAAFDSALVVEDLPPGAWGIHLPPGLIMISSLLPTIEDRRITTAHEGIHADMRRSSLHHEHGDVWAATLAVLMPRALLRRCANAPELAVAARVPLWAAVLRMAMTSVMHPTHDGSETYTGVLTHGL